MLQDIMARLKDRQEGKICKLLQIKRHSKDRKKKTQNGWFPELKILRSVCRTGNRIRVRSTRSMINA